MQVIMTSPKGVRYMTKPIASGLCYEVFIENEQYGKVNKAGKIDDREWKSLEIYPGTFEYALECMVRRMLLNPKEDSFIQTIDKNVTNALKQIRKCLNTYLEKITIDMEKEK